MEAIKRTMIYLVMGHVSYESDEVVRAFASREMAEAFLAEIEAYEKTRPVYPEKPRGDFPLWEWQKRVQKWGRQCTVWVQGHPAGGHYGQDRYSIEEHELIQEA